MTVILLIISCAFAVVILKPFSNINSEQFVKYNILSFYTDLNSNDMKRILPHFNDKVERWFSLYSPTLFQINYDIKTYSKKYPFKKINVLWQYSVSF
jgi:hypothetical protein